MVITGEFVRDALDARYNLIKEAGYFGMASGDQPEDDMVEDVITMLADDTGVDSELSAGYYIDNLLINGVYFAKEDFARYGYNNLDEAEEDALLVGDDYILISF